MQLIFPPIVINTLLYIAFAYFYLEYQFLCKIYFKEEGNMKYEGSIDHTIAYIFNYFGQFLIDNLF